MKPIEPAPVYTTTPGPYGVAVSGAWKLTPGPTATISLEVSGPPVGAWLYIAGRDRNLPVGDPNIQVKIRNSKGSTTIPRVPVKYATATDVTRFVNRINISRYIAEGANTIAISGWDYEFPEGAFAYAVYDAGAGAPLKLIQVLDGADIGWFPHPPPFGPDSELASFLFAPSAFERGARVLLAISDAEAGRGDEVFGFTGTGVPSDQLRDSDGDGCGDIVNRRVALTRVDLAPLRVDRANAAGALEAHRLAFSVEEDCLGVARKDGGCSIGPEFNIVSWKYTIPSGHEHADFQVQSEDPENGDSFMLIVALNELPVDGFNPAPGIEVIKNATPMVLPERPYGQEVRFDVTVNNLGGEDLLLDALADSVFGNVAAVQGLVRETTCVVPRTIPFTGRYDCHFVAEVTGTMETPHRDVVIATGTGAESGLQVQDDDDAFVIFTREGLGSLGDRVWLDADRDGAQDPGEEGIDGLTVLLRDAGTNAEIARTATATNGPVSGFYLFANLQAGSYKVEVVPLPGMQQTYDLDGTGTANVAVRALVAAEAASDVDFGYAPLVPPNPDFTLTKVASIEEGYPGDLVTYVFTVKNTGTVRLENLRVNDDKLGYIGTVTLEVGESRQLTKPDFALPVCGATTLTVDKRCDGTTADAGFCSLPNTAIATWDTLNRTAKDCVDILPFGSIGDFVWEDRDKDGRQDPGEPGLGGVTLTLSRNGEPVATTTTGAAGGYLFTRLKAASYAVDSGGKAGYSPTTAESLPVALGIGQTYLDADFGYWKPVPKIAVTKIADPTFGYLFRADPTTPWPYALVTTPLEVDYTVAVTNPGDEPLADVTVTDDPATLVFTYRSGDVNGDTKLDLTETWVYTATWKYDRPGFYPDTVTARGTGAVSGTEVSDTADAAVEAVGCGQCLGKVSVLSLRYDGKAAATVTVEVLNRKFADRVAFSGRVQPGEVFTFGPLSSRIGGFDGTLGTNIELRVNGAVNTTIHTSCSQPIYPGLVRGAFTVVSGSSKRGGLLCPLLEK